MGFCLFSGTPPSPIMTLTNLKTCLVQTMSGLFVNLTNIESSVNLTWSLDNHMQCVVMYHVEVTNTNTSDIMNLNTISQYIVLTLQTGVVYSIRVRGADSAGRGEWSEPFQYTPSESL